MTVMFNTLAFADKLIAAGMDRKAAEAIARGLADDVIVELVTKADLEKALQAQTIRLGGMLFALGGLLVAAVALLR